MYLCEYIFQKKFTTKLDILVLNHGNETVTKSVSQKKIYIEKC